MCIPEIKKSLQDLRHTADKDSHNKLFHFPKINICSIFHSAYQIDYICTLFTGKFDLAGSDGIPAG